MCCTTLRFLPLACGRKKKKSLRARRLVLFGAATFAACVALCLTLPQTRGLLIAPAHITGSAHLWTYTTNCLLAFLLLPFTLRTTGMESDRTDRMLGDMSYLVYLFHYPGGVIFVQWRLCHRSKYVLVYLASVWLGTFAVSVTFWRYAHLPIRTLRKSSPSQIPLRKLRREHSKARNLLTPAATEQNKTPCVSPLSFCLSSAHSPAPSFNILPQTKPVSPPSGQLVNVQAATTNEFIDSIGVATHSNYPRLYKNRNTLSR